MYSNVYALFVLVFTFTLCYSWISKSEFVLTIKKSRRTFYCCENFDKVELLFFSLSVSQSNFPLFSFVWTEHGNVNLLVNFGRKKRIWKKKKPFYSKFLNADIIDEFKAKNTHTTKQSNVMISERNQNEIQRKHEDKD